MFQYYRKHETACEFHCTGQLIKVKATTTKPMFVGIGRLVCIPTPKETKPIFYYVGHHPLCGYIYSSPSFGGVGDTKKMCVPYAAMYLNSNKTTNEDLVNMELVVNRVKFKWVDGQEYEFNVQCLVSARTLKKTSFAIYLPWKVQLNHHPRRLPKVLKAKVLKDKAKVGKACE